MKNNFYFLILTLILLGNLRVPATSAEVLTELNQEGVQITVSHEADYRYQISAKLDDGQPFQAKFATVGGPTAGLILDVFGRRIYRRKRIDVGLKNLERVRLGVHADKLRSVFDFPSAKNIELGEVSQVANQYTLTFTLLDVDPKLEQEKLAEAPVEVEQVIKPLEEDSAPAVSATAQTTEPQVDLATTTKMLAETSPETPRIKGMRFKKTEKGEMAAVITCVGLSTFRFVKKPDAVYELDVSGLAVPAQVLNRPFYPPGPPAGLQYMQAELLTDGSTRFKFGVDPEVILQPVRRDQEIWIEVRAR
ncbi:hypothetical protein JNK13_02890 [bacterium]|nr:hypothetical protein [bacterium]